MTDIELLEAAAKAAKYAICTDAPFVAMGGGTPKLYTGNNGPEWNPLTNDGDAFRLSADLNIDVEHHYDCVFANGFDSIQDYQLLEWHYSDRRAAARRAIVSAAAQIGAKA